MSMVAVRGSCLIKTACVVYHTACVVYHRTVVYICQGKLKEKEYSVLERKGKI